MSSLLDLRRRAGIKITEQDRSVINIHTRQPMTTIDQSRMRAATNRMGSQSAHNLRARAREILRNHGIDPAVLEDPFHTPRG